MHKCSWQWRSTITILYLLGMVLGFWKQFNCQPLATWCYFVYQHVRLVETDCETIRFICVRRKGMVGGIIWSSCVTIIKLTLSWTKASWSSEVEKISAIPLVTWDYYLQFIKTMVWKHQLNGLKGKTKYQYEGCGKHASTLHFGKPYWLFATPGIKQVILASIF